MIDMGKVIITEIAQKTITRKTKIYIIFTEIKKKKKIKVEVEAEAIIVVTVMKAIIPTKTVHIIIIIITMTNIPVDQKNITQNMIPNILQKTPKTITYHQNRTIKITTKFIVIQSIQYQTFLPQILKPR